MIHPDMLALGTTRSCIRELFEYGLQQAAVVGKENVFDYSLGNPSIPSPKEVNEAICQIVKEQSPLDVHGYTSAPGYPVSYTHLDVYKRQMTAWVLALMQACRASKSI